jgi:DNA-directed RNA polymerase specialized sigma24 family protein
MEIIKTLENELNDLKTKEKSIELAEKVKQENISRIKTIKEAMENLTEYERKIIQLNCIEGMDIEATREALGVSRRKLFIDKKETLKKLVRLMYGSELLKGDK